MGQEIKARIDRMPRPGEIVVMVQHVAPFDEPEIFFEPTRAFYARQLVARPRMLLSFARKVAWLNFKMMVKGKPRPTIATVAERIGNEG